MEFTVETKQFAAALAKVTLVIQRKHVFAGLDHIKLVAADNELTISGLNPDTLVRATIDADIVNDGEILVPANRLNAIIKAMKSKQEFTFTSTEDVLKASIISDSGLYEMPVMSTDDLYLLPFEDTELFEKVLTVPDNKLTVALKDTIPFVSADEFRPAMSGILFELRSDYLKLVSTDSFRLSRSEFKADGVTDKDFILPISAANILSKEGFNCQIFTQEIDGRIKAVQFLCDGLEVITKTIDETFPPYASITPESFINGLGIGCTELTDALNRVKIFTDEVEHRVDMDIDAAGNSFDLRCESETTLATETLAIAIDKSDSDGVNISFNEKYLAQVLKTLGKNEIHIGYNASDKPAELERAGDDLTVDTKIILMPVRKH